MVYSPTSLSTGNTWIQPAMSFGYCFCLSGFPLSLIDHFFSLPKMLVCRCSQLLRQYGMIESLLKNPIFFRALTTNNEECWGVVKYGLTHSEKRLVYGGIRPSETTVIFPFFCFLIRSFPG